MKKVQCKNCGLLGIRNHQTRNLEEVEPTLREEWLFLKDDTFLDGKLDKCPECFAGVKKYQEEIQLALFRAASLPYPRVPKLAYLIRRILAKKRLCGSFSELHPGFSPKQHKQGVPTRANLLEDHGHKNEQTSLAALLSVSDLVTQTGLKTARVESALRRYRKKFPDCCEEVDCRHRNEPKYLYRVADVMPLLEKLKAKS